MSTLNQFFDTGEKLGEVISMFSSELPTLVSSGGGYYLRSGYAADNRTGRYTKFTEFPRVKGYTMFNEHTAGTVFGISSYSAPVCKIGSYYLTGKYRSNTITSAYETVTLNTLTSIYSNVEFNGVYVATGSGGLNYSTDGVNFNYVALIAGEYLTVKNEHNNLCVAYQYNNISTSTAGRIYTSTDGVNWTARTLVCDTNITLVRYVWCSFMNAFIVITKEGAFSTTDGFTLTRLAASFMGSYYYNAVFVACGTNSIVAVHFDTNTVYRSTNGIDWTVVLTSTPTFALNTVYYSNGVYYVNTTNGFHSSVDQGLTWTYSTFAGSSGLIGSLYAIGEVDGFTYFRCSAGGNSTEFGSNPTVSNHVSCKAKGEPADGYAYVRIA